MVEAGNDSGVWAATELLGVKLGDQRPERRAVTLLAALLDHPDQSLPQACEAQWAATKATYRFPRK